MIPIVKRELPEITPAMLDAIRTRTSFSVPNIDASGFHSTYNNNSYLVQHAGVLLANYDKEADLWFVVNEPLKGHKEWVREIIKQALGDVAIAEMSLKEINHIRKHGYVSAVRKRMGINNERTRR